MTDLTAVYEDSLALHKTASAAALEAADDAAAAHEREAALEVEGLLAHINTLEEQLAKERARSQRSAVAADPPPQHSAHPLPDPSRVREMMMHLRARAREILSAS